jgi:hypothetical protein
LDYLLFGILSYPTSFTVFHWFHSLPIYYGFPSVLRRMNHFSINHKTFNTSSKASQSSLHLDLTLCSDISTDYPQHPLPRPQQNESRQSAGFVPYPALSLPVSTSPTCAHLRGTSVQKNDRDIPPACQFFHFRTLWARDPKHCLNLILATHLFNFSANTILSANNSLGPYGYHGREVAFLLPSIYLDN